jgi:hypothetical protein
MRIITIRRNCQFLINALEVSFKQTINPIESEIIAMFSMVKKIEFYVEFLKVKGGFEKVSLM